jgi:oligoribonuclease
MSDPKSEFLVWLDMEMSGLDPQTCVPLEIAVILTTADLEERESYHAVIHQDDAALATMNDFVRNMHTANGLLEKVASSTVTLAQADASVAELVGRSCEEGEALLAGNSIHQDRRFIERYFPELEKRLHYRMVDVSTVKELARRWYGESAVFPKPASDHTALADTRQSIAELAFYRKSCFR